MLTLYYMAMSPPCRAVLLLAATMGIDMNLKEVNLMTQDQLTPEFIKMNPQHTVPTLDDDGFILWESRAIMSYMVGKYGKDDSLYPKDLQVRAKVDQMLYFDIGLFYRRFFDYMISVVGMGQKPDETQFKKIQDACDILNKAMEGHDWVAGNNMTIGDISLAVTVSSAEGVGLDVSQYPNVNKWYTHVKTSIPSYQTVNQVQADKMGGMFKEKAKA